MRLSLSSHLLLITMVAGAVGMTACGERFPKADPKASQSTPANVPGGKTGLLAGWRADHTLKAIALLGTGAAFLVGLAQYRKAQQWKRAEWVAQELKDFLKDPQVAAALNMVDWEARDIDLFPDREGAKRYVFVESGEVIKALRHHSEIKRGEGERRFSEKEAAIRDAFDKLCDGLERFESYIEVGLIEESDVEPYLDYWGIHLRPDSETERLRQIRKFMRSYDWQRAENLLDRFKPKVLVAKAK